MNELKPCPCGQIPNDISIEDAGQGGKWAWVSGDCCAEWAVEFRTQYEEGIKLYDLAVEAWNEAPRATLSGTVITKSEDTWPPDGREFIWREPIERDLDQRPEITLWDKHCVNYIGDWLGCIWWPADMFEPPRGEL